MYIFRSSISPIFFAAFENTAIGTGQYTVNVGDIRPVTQTSNLAQTDVLDVSLTKTVNLAQAVEGDQLTYVVTITNNSSIPISNVVLKDIVDPNTVYDATNRIPYVTLSNGYNVGTIPARSAAPNNVFTLTFTATINQNVRGTVTNTANLVSYTYTDVNGITYNGTPQQATATTVVQDIDVHINKSVLPENAQVGDTVIYSITVLNNSSTQITGVTVVDASADLSFASITNISVNGAVLSPQPSLSSGVTIGTIAASTSATVSFSATVLATAPSAIHNTSLVTYSYNNGQTIITVPNIPSNLTTLTIVKPGITVEKYANATILINDGTAKQVQYSVYVKNTGNTPVDNVIITDVLPVNMVYSPQSTYISGVGPTDNSPEPQTGGIYIGTVAAGATIPVLFSVDVQFI